MLKDFLELSIDEINNVFNEAFNNMSEEEKKELYNEANVFDYITPKPFTSNSFVVKSLNELIKEKSLWKLDEQKIGIARKENALAA